MQKTQIKQRIITEQQKLHPHPVLNRILLARGIQHLDECQTDLQHLLRPQQLSNIDRAVSLLVKAWQKKQSIMIVGDYDVDGATSTALLMRALKAFGFSHVDYITPNRFKLGYGFSPELLKTIDRNQFDLIITVDNGIASIQAVSEAKKQGFDVIVTDHHLPAAELPPADAIVNPNLPNDSFPSKNLAGVGVVFYLLLQLRKVFIEQQLISEKINLANYLDLVALGTVADVVPLDRNNRLLVKNGIKRIQAGFCIAGIKALCEVAGRELHNITSSDLGFAVAPRLNAAGRLEDMETGIECLLSDNEQQALDYAKALNEINLQRREIEAEMKQQAESQLDAIESALANPKQLFGITLFHQHWHEGVIGILAARIKEKSYRPTIVFTQSDQKDILKGSARSIPGVHIRDVLEQIDSHYPGLIIKFGGHAMAAGLSIAKDKATEFALVFDHFINKACNGKPPQACIEHDGSLQESDLNLAFAEQLQQFGPWGQAFPEPLFIGKFTIAQKRILANKHSKMTLQYGQTTFIDAIGFNQIIEQMIGDTIEVIYKLDINEYQGNRNIQLIIEKVL